MQYISGYLSCKDKKKAFVGSANSTYTPQRGNPSAAIKLPFRDCSFVYFNHAVFKASDLILFFVFVFNYFKNRINCCIFNPGFLLNSIYFSIFCPFVYDLNNITHFCF